MTSDRASDRCVGRAFRLFEEKSEGISRRRRAWRYESRLGKADDRER